MAYLILFLWAIRALKSELFWLYLLQLKEYKLNRLIDHFRTEKGKRVLLDRINLFKVLLVLASSFIYNNLANIVLIIYIIESAAAARNIYRGAILKPIATSKSTALTVILVAIQAAFGWTTFVYAFDMNELAKYLIVFDILIPAISISVIMLLKPANLLLKQGVIKQAKEKKEKLQNLLVIGITGSYGKTSTKEFLREILKNRFNVIATPEHVNTEIGIANFMLNKVTPKHEIFICEMGAYEKGEIKAICDIVQPKIGIFIGANEQHLSLFGSMEELLSAEGGEELLSALPNGNSDKGLGIFNGNNKYAYDLYKKASIPKKITYVPNLIEIINPEKRDARAENINVRKDHVAVNIITNKNSKGVEFKINLLGSYNIENILLCVALAEALGMNLEEIKRASKDIAPLRRAMSILKNSNGVNVINSTYSSNPSAVEAHLDYLKVWGSAKKVVIMPCLIELGSASSKIHMNIGRSLAKIADLSIIAAKDKFADILSGGEAAIGKNAARDKIVYIENAKQIFEKIKSFCKKGDVILLEGRLPEKLIELLEK